MAGKILVTGGAGYIGGAMVKRLLAENYEVVILDKSITNEAKLYQGNILDKNLLNKIMVEERPDAVMHFAAFIEPGESMKDPGKFFINNVLGTQTVIEACVKNNVKKFIFSSTCAVFEGSNEPLSEASTISPANFYGQTKLMVENLLAWNSRIYGLKYAVLRYFNAAGAISGYGEKHQPEIHLIPKIIDVALGKTSKIDIYGNDYMTPDKTCIRDYIHIADLVEAHWLVLQSLDNKSPLIYNLGTGKGYSNLEVVEMVRKITGKEIKINFLPRRPGDAPRLVASSAKIQKELGWKAKNDLNNIIESAWEWHKEYK